MKKLLPLLVLSLLAPSAASAQAVGAASAKAWVAPMVGAAMGSHLHGSGSVSLDALTMPGPDLRLPFVGSPQLLAPLVSVLEQQGLTPATFNALSAPVKSKILLAVAPVAEERADRAAAEAVRLSAGVTAPRYEDARSRVKEADGVAIYLTNSRRAQVDAARAALAEAKPKIQALYDAYDRDLAGKVAAGALSGTNFIRHTPDGWTAGDESPEKRYESLNALYHARLNRLELRVGPWSPAEAGLIKDSLFRLDVARALEKERPGSLREIERKATLREQEARSWEKSYAAGLNMVRTSMRFTARVPRSEDFDSLSRLYAWALDYSETSGERAHKLAAIAKGHGGLPGWKRVEELRAMAHASALAAASLAKKGFIVLTAVGGSLGVAHYAVGLGPWLLLATAAGLIALLVFGLVSLHREYELRRSWDWDKINKYFERSPILD